MPIGDRQVRRFFTECGYEVVNLLGLAAIAEFWLDKPVIAINTATYWWALRQNGIQDKIEGFGSLLLGH
jgi:maleate isomerase